MPTPDLTSSPTLDVVTWDDPIVDSLGHPARSTYVERFWLPILGPSTTWLIRRIDTALAATPDGASLDLEAVAGALGLGSGRGRHSPLIRAFHRCCQFGMARATPEAHLAVRRNLPPLTRRQIERLPAAVRDDHERWRELERDAGTLDPQRRRARHMAMGLVELGEDGPTVEQRLVRLSVHPAIAHEAATWARRIVDGRPGEHRTPTPAPAPTPTIRRAPAGPVLPRPAAPPPRRTPASIPSEWGDDAA